MEKFVAGFAVLAALLVLAANVSVSEAQTVEKYFKAGGELQLSPQKVSEKIYSIVWKYDKNLLAEWVEGSIELEYYSKFKDRSELNTTTGVLLVQRMTAADSGLYSVEINNKVQSRVYQTVVIQEVPQPAVDLQPLTCSRLDKCGLKCHGAVDKAGPVSYFWKKDDGEWETSGDKKELSDEEMDNVKTFSCRMKNPVSEKDSEPFNNPFYREKKPADKSSIGLIVGCVVAVVVVVLAFIGLCFWKREPIMKKISSFRANGAPSNPESSNSNDKVNDQLLQTAGKNENELQGIKSDPDHTEKSASPSSVEASA